MNKQPTYTGWAIIFVVAFAIAFPAIKYFDNSLPQNLHGDGMYILFSMIVFVICFWLIYKATQMIKARILENEKNN